MGFISWNEIGNFLGLGKGKDNYTQTKIFNIRNVDLSKGEQWVNVNPTNLYHLYQTTPQLRAVIDAKAGMMSFGCWKEYELKNGKESIVENSQLVQFLENPNPLQDGNEWIRQNVIAYNIYGNAINNIVDSQFKIMETPPKALWLLPTQFITIERTGKIFKTTSIDEIIKEYRLYHTDKVFDQYETKDILHFKNSNPDDPILGTSKIESLQMPISNIRGAYGFRNRIISSNSMLGILSSEASGMAGGNVVFDDNQQKKFNDSKNKTFGMQEGKSDLYMTQANVKYTPTSFPTKDLMLFEEIDQDFKTIIDTFGLNSNMFSFDRGATFENVKESLKMAYQNTIIPEGEQIAMGVSKKLGLDGRTRWLKLSFDHLEILKADKKVNAEVLKMNIETAEKLRLMGKIIESDTLINECFN